MTEQNNANQVTLADVAKALDIVGILLGQLTIPAARAQEFAVTNKVLGDLKAFVDAKLNPPQAQAEEVENSGQADVESSGE